MISLALFELDEHETVKITNMAIKFTVFTSCFLHFVGLFLNNVMVKENR
jgi:hypothetical protein